jgi:hypothetical protein
MQPSAFTLAADAQQIVADLVARESQFAHLQQHTVGCLSAEGLTDRGAPARAVISIPAQVTSKAHERQLLEWCYIQLFRPLYGDTLPDFVIYFDRERWRRDAPLVREQLCFHELCHVQQRKDEWGAPKFEKSGRAALHLVPHDVERFYSELERYADVIPGTAATARAIVVGSTRRRLRVA